MRRMNDRGSVVNGARPISNRCIRLRIPRNIADIARARSSVYPDDRA